MASEHQNPGIFSRAKKEITERITAVRSYFVGEDCVQCKRQFQHGKTPLTSKFCSFECYFGFIKTQRINHQQCLMPGCERRCSYDHQNQTWYDHCGYGHAHTHREQLRWIYYGFQQSSSIPHYYLSGNGTIYFYDKDRPFYDFTNFANYPIIVDNFFYHSTEHYFQSQKLAGTLYERYVALLPRARDAFEFPRQTKVSEWVRRDWAEIKEKVMFKALYHKFTQYPELTKLLLHTKNRVLVEDSPLDSYWGNGKDKRGRNRLGVLLMRLRRVLRGETIHNVNYSGVSTDGNKASHTQKYDTHSNITDNNNGGEWHSSTFVTAESDYNQLNTTGDCDHSRLDTPGNSDPNQLDTPGNGDPNRHGNGDPNQHGDGDPNQLITPGNGDPNRHGSGDPNLYGDSDPNQLVTPGNCDPNRHGNGDPNQHGGDPNQHGNGDPNQHGGDPNQHGDSDPNQLVTPGNCDPNRHGNGDPNQHGGDPNQHGNGDPNQHGDSDANQLVTPGNGDPNQLGEDPNQHGDDDPNPAGHGDSDDHNEPIECNRGNVDHVIANVTNKDKDNGDPNDLTGDGDKIGDGAGNGSGIEGCHGTEGDESGKGALNTASSNDISAPPPVIHTGDTLPLSNAANPPPAPSSCFTTTTATTTSNAEDSINNCGHLNLPTKNDIQQIEYPAEIDDGSHTDDVEMKTLSTGNDIQLINHPENGNGSHTDDVEMKSSSDNSVEDEMDFDEYEDIKESEI